MNYYEILQISKNASKDDIKHAYITLVKKYHPDLQPQEKKNFYTEKMKLINIAYGTLKNDEKRKAYDEQLNYNKQIYKETKYQTGSNDNNKYNENSYKQYKYNENSYKQYTYNENKHNKYNKYNSIVDKIKKIKEIVMLWFTYILVISFFIYIFSIFIYILIGG